MKKPPPAQLTIELCMGSSCYSRGNSRSVQILETFIKEKKLEEKIMLKGRLCCGTCSDGPCITIGETHYKKVSPNTACELALKHLEAANDK